MAKRNAVWGIDIGQCALKAIRCTLADDGETVIADAFDYIEYPKLLTQPEADAEELVREALQQFLSRNPTKGDRVAVAVSGQAGLARFIKLPPVEVKKIPDIVKYEAKQQIPFKLEEVIWDYQQLPGAVIEEGFAMEAEVGLFAMKREQVFRAIAPYERAGIELDVVQLAPLCIYNAISHDMLPEVENYDPDNAPEYIVVLSIGTETTDLVITNGYRVWQRSIPLGGNHFTRQLTKELKLTFAKAEHLKRNARQAEDPKTVFQAMRPVFNDLEKEVRRSINFFRNNDRNAQLGKMVLLGNTTKLPGLPQYLEKNLEMEVVKPEAFNKLEGADVVDSPAFKENVLAFPVCYGLALQGLGKGRLATNLVPRELLTARLIKEKKPWAVAALAVLLLGLMLNFVFQYLAWSTVKKDRELEGVTWTAALSAVQGVQSTAQSYETTDKSLKDKLALVEAIGEEVIGNADGRLLWTELLRAINSALPIDPNIPPGETPDPIKLPFGERQTLYITAIESQYFEDLALWFTEPVKQRYLENERALAAEDEAAEGAANAVGEGAAPADAATEETPAAEEPAPVEPTSTATSTTDPNAPAAEGEGPSGPGWVIELRGYHYYNLKRETEGSKHLRRTLIRNLEEGEVLLPPGPGQPPIRWTMKELGIMYPIIAQDSKIDKKHRVPNPLATPTTGEAGGPYGPGLRAEGGIASGFGGFGQTGPVGTARNPAARGGAANRAGAKSDEPEQPLDFEAPKYEFVVQFAWQEKKISERLANRKKEAEAAQAAAAEAGAIEADMEPEAEDVQAPPPGQVQPQGQPPAQPQGQPQQGQPQPPAAPQGAPPDAAAPAEPPAPGVPPGAPPPAGGQANGAGVAPPNGAPAVAPPAPGPGPAAGPAPGPAAAPPAGAVPNAPGTLPVNPNVPNGPPAAAPPPAAPGGGAPPGAGAPPG